MNIFVLRKISLFYILNHLPRRIKTIYMRKIIAITASIFLLVLSAFSQNDKEKNNDNDKNTIEGSGNVITKDVSVQPFDQLEASGVFSVSLSQGAKESVKIEAEDNLQSLFEVKN